VFLALFKFDNRTLRLFDTDEAKIRLALDPFENADGWGSYESPQARLFQTSTYNTATSALEPTPYICPNTGLVLASWHRLDNRRDLARKLSIAAVELSHTTDAQLIIASYLKWGDACVEHLVGDFSFVIFDPKNKTVFAARDHLGVKPFYYVHTDRYLILTSSARLFHALDDLRLTPSEEWIARYALFISADYEKTPWLQVKKLAPAHQLSCAANGRLVTNRYFDFIDDAPSSFTRSEEYVTAYRAALDEAVRCRLNSDFAIGCETSGGLDSSAITGLAAMFTAQGPQDLHTFGFARLEREPEFLLRTSQLHRIQNNHVYMKVGTPEEKRQLAERSLTLLGHPPEDNNGSHHELFYKDCERWGVRTLLSGFGGDEVVTNHGDLLKAELFDARKFRLLFDNVGGKLATRPLRLLRQVKRQRNRRAGESALMAKRKQLWDGMLLSDNVADRFHLEQTYVDAMRYDYEHRTINGYILQGRLTPYLTSRLECCTLMAAARKVEYRWPLLDVRLMQQYLSTPSIEKFSHGTTRYLHRQALQGVVPEEVRWKPTKNMGRLALEAGNNPVDGNYLANQFQRLATELHPAVADVLDRNKLSERVTTIKNLDRHRNRSEWSIYNKQLQTYESLNEWLTTYHS